MQTDLLCQIAVSSATYAIDKPYTYLLPEPLTQRARPGMRVMIPFGTGNRRVEGLILDLMPGERKKGLKAVMALLDEVPMLDQDGIRLALWMHERYYCTVYDAVKAMLPAGLYFSLKGSLLHCSGNGQGCGLPRCPPPSAQKVLDLIYANGARWRRERCWRPLALRTPARPCGSCWTRVF